MRETVELAIRDVAIVMFCVSMKDDVFCRYTLVPHAKMRAGGGVRIGVSTEIETVYKWVLP